MLRKGHESSRNALEFLTSEDRIPQDHLQRQIDGAVDFMHLYDFKKASIRANTLASFAIWPASFYFSYIPLSTQ